MKKKFAFLYVCADVIRNSTVVDLSDRWRPIQVLIGGRPPALQGPNGVNAVTEVRHGVLGWKYASTTYPVIFIELDGWHFAFILKQKYTIYK